MHLPIIYSDTVAMPIPIAIIYTYLCMDRLNEKIIINKKNIVLITIMGFLITIGMKIKFTCIIAFLGIITDIIFNKRIKVNIKNLSFIFLSILSFSRRL